MRAVTVLVADDHAIVREGIISLLKEHEFDIVGSVGDGLALIEAAGRLRPDVIITDISMPALSGIEALTRLATLKLPSKVIVLTMHDDAELASRAVKAGAAGFVLKEAAPDELINAIGQVMQGRLYLTPAVTRDVVARAGDGHTETGPHLSPRQMDVLRLILLGQRMKEIAATSNLSPRTVEAYKYQMMDVLGVRSTAELIRYAIKHRLIAD